MSTDRVESDIDEKTLLVTPPKSQAAGVEAVLVSLRRGIEQMGLARTARTLVKLNQRNGFDCPGCAWPETPGRRKHAEFRQNGAKAVAEEARLILQTMRSHDQYNTIIYGLDDRYRGITNGRRVLLINENDIVALGYTDGDIVDLVSEWPRADGTTHQRRAPNFRLIAYPNPVGNVAAYYPETNPLIPLDHVADKSNAPVSKAVTIRLEPARS
ncbi:hypothetical protein ABID74_003567 [Gordonia terrae]